MWFKWLLIGLFTLSPLITIAQIGKPRKPVETDTAIGSVILAGLLIWGVAVNF